MTSPLHPRDGARGDVPDSRKFGNVSVDLSNITVGPTSNRSFINRNGHSLWISSSSVKCMGCDEEFEVPDLLQQSSGFRQAVYKLFLVSKVCESSCDRSQESDGRDEPLFYDRNTNWRDAGPIYRSSDMSGNVKLHDPNGKVRRATKTFK